MGKRDRRRERERQKKRETALLQSIKCHLEKLKTKSINFVLAAGRFEKADK